MSSTLLEVTGGAHEDVERLESLIVQEMQREPENGRDRLFQSHRVHIFFSISFCRGGATPTKFFSRFNLLSVSINPIPQYLNLSPYLSWLSHLTPVKISCRQHCLSHAVSVRSWAFPSPTPHLSTNRTHKRLRLLPPLSLNEKRYVRSETLRMFRCCLDQVINHRG